MIHKELAMLFLDMGDGFAGVFFIIILYSVHLYFLQFKANRKKKKTILSVMCSRDKCVAKLEACALFGRALH